MASIVPIDEFVADGGYPGHPGPEADQPSWLIDPYTPFRAEDESRFWYLDFHWPRGLTPMGLLTVAASKSLGTQYAAEQLPLPVGHGLSVRTAGTHVYGSEIPLGPDIDRADRTARFAKVMPPFIQNFRQLWEEARTEIESDWQRLRRADLTAMSRTQLRDYAHRARAHHQRAWQIHFEFMYPLLANYLAFRGLCIELGIDPNDVAKFLQCGDTKIMATDRELWALAAAARTAGLESTFETGQPDTLVPTLAKAGGKATAWLAKFRSFLDTYGWRTEGIDDPGVPSWAEDPTSPIGTIKTFLQKAEPHDFTGAQQLAREVSETAVETARSRLTREEQRVFDAGLASCQEANFTWWNEEHDFYIDLRAHLPLRRACLAAAGALGADEPDDTLFLFWPELISVLDGRSEFSSYQGIIADRRQYFDHWGERRATMPKVLGTVPETIKDPIMIEVFGINTDFLHAVHTGTTGDAQEMRGVPAAGGRARGAARVLSDSDELHQIETGEVLVCESTSPNWTPAFAKIAACVCDSGGSLSHAAIVGREYGVPTVTGLGVATLQIRDGDDVEVDGSIGKVIIHRRAATEASP